MTDTRSQWVRQELARIRAQVDAAETVLERIRAKGRPGAGRERSQHPADDRSAARAGRRHGSAAGR